MASGEKGFDYTAAYRRGNGIYLSPGETFDEEIAKAAAVLAENNVTAQEIGSSLRLLTSTYNRFLGYRLQEPQQPCPEIKLKRKMWELGREIAPFGNGKYTSYIDWWVWVDGLGNGNRADHPPDGPTVISEMLPDLISDLGFFEGSVYYGIDPLWAISVHRFTEHRNLLPYKPLYSKEAWSVKRSYSGDGQEHDSILDKSNLAPMDIIANSIAHERLPGNIFAYVAPGKLELKLDKFSQPISQHKHRKYWGLLLLQEDVILSPDATLLGLPLDAHINQLHKGDAEVIEVWLGTDKLVG